MTDTPSLPDWLRNTPVAQAREAFQAGYEDGRAAERGARWCRDCGHDGSECDCDIPELYERVSYERGYQDGKLTGAADERQRIRQPVPPSILRILARNHSIATDVRAGLAALADLLDGSGQD